jgi:protein-S-isoprenylcysteine O-methyltransferase Ste14
MMSDLSRYLPLAGLVLFFAIGLVWRAWLQYRRHGNAGLILFRPGPWSQHLRDLLFVALLLTASCQAIAFAMSPSSLSAACILPPPVEGVWLALGVLLLFGGTAFMVAAQLRLGASWRVGIDEGASPGLVTAGLYRLSRNPIFLGIFVTLAGLVVLLPTWISLAVLIGTIVSIRYQVLAEEAYLTSTYGDAYRGYAGRVGRFLPCMGRLRRA